MFDIIRTGTRNLLKWKGVMFAADEEKDTSEGDSSCAATIGTNPTPGTEKDLDFNGLVTDEDGHKVNYNVAYLGIISFVLYTIY